MMVSNRRSNNFLEGHVWVGPLLAIAIWLVMFWPALIGTHEFGFRDSATLYQPLYRWTAQRWLAGSVPLWCWQDNWGGPLIADATSGVFYPGKVIFLLQGILPFHLLFNWFVALHCLFAVVAASWCGRVFGLSAPARWMVGIAYGFGGAVLFQTCNVVFLVSSAWLPLAIALVFRVREASSGTTSNIVDIKRAIQLAIVMSMMVLVGDPQMAYHVGLIALIYWVGTAWQNSNWKSAFISLTVTTLLTFLFSAIQVLPTIEWSQRSERVAEQSETDGNGIARPIPGTHADASYQFSLPPWSVLEMAWPNALGKMDFASGSRWSSSLAGADRIWSGSYYSGVIMFLLMLSLAFSKQKQTLDKWLLGIGILFLLAAFGWYGPVWLLNELQLMRGGIGVTHWVGEPTGGIYWILQRLVPLYDDFRYPAKLFVVASLAFCLLSGKALDRFFVSTEMSNDDQRIHSSLKLPLLLLAIPMFLFGLFIVGQLFSGVSLNGAVKEFSGSIVHAAFVIGIGLILLCMVGRQRKTSWAVWVLVIVSSIDIAIANRWTICTVPKIDEPIEIVDSSLRQTYYRSRIDQVVPTQSPGQDGLREQMNRDRLLLFPKHHLNTSHRLVGSFYSIQPLDVAELLAAIEKTDLPLPVLESLSVTGVVAGFPESLQQTGEIASLQPYNLIVGLPRIYFATSIKRVDPIDEKSVSAVRERTKSFIEHCDGNLLFPGSQRAFVESEKEVLDSISQESKLPVVVAVVSETTNQNRLQLSVSLKEPRLLVVADYFDKNWQVWRVDPDGRRSRLPVVRVNRVLRGIVASQGTYQIEMRYVPTWFFVGSVVSLLTWILVSLFWLLRLRRQASPLGSGPNQLGQDPV